jgi:Flp pilus assembly protein TadG
MDRLNKAAWRRASGPRKKSVADRLRLEYYGVPIRVHRLLRAKFPPPDRASTKITGVHKISEVIMTRKNEAGQALIFGVVTLGLLLLGFTGLGIDIGYLRYEKRLQQTAADDAAVAAATELRYASGNPSSAALNASGANGFTAASTGTGCPPPAPASAVGSVAVTVNNPPCSGTHQDIKHVEVYVAEVQPTFFMKILGTNYATETVTARAVATLKTGTADSCLYTLGNGNGIQGITVSGTPTLNAPTCGIDDNGDFGTNGSKLRVTAASLGVAGNIGKVQGNVTPAPVGPVTPAGDPLSYLTPPGSEPAGACTATSCTAGTYSSFSLSGGNVTLQSGTYIVNGSMTINGNANVTGTGVTFYITNSGSVTINGTGNVQLSAPTTGAYAGILLYQDPSDTSAAKINGTSTSFFQGSLYFPKASLDISGTSGTGTCPNGTISNGFNGCAAYTLIVSDALKVSGNATVTINSDYSSLPGGDPVMNAVLVE